MRSNPIFIIGTERSGSNLLRLQLNSHSRISIPHPPHIMRDMAPLARQYGSLQDRANLQRLVRDVVRVVNLHFAPWPFAIREETLLAKLESPSLYGIYAALYELYLEHTGKARWGCKSTFMYQQIEEILHHHQEPRFLHLIRDPRDVAASAEQSIFSHYHPYKQAELWTHQQAEIERWARLKGEGKLLCVRYEDLTANPERELRTIMAFLGEEFEDEQLQAFRSAEATSLARLSESWKNCAMPVSRKSVGRFRSQLSPREVSWVEFHALPLMRKYGYTPVSPVEIPRPSRVRELLIEGAELWKMVAAEAQAVFADRNFSLRWKKRLYLRLLQSTRSVAHG